MTQPLTLYLARHATPNRNTAVDYNLPPGPPLLPKGEDEARELGAYLKAQGVVKMYVSPMLRTQQTAKIAAKASGIPCETNNEIIEWQRGQTEDDVQQRMSTVWHKLVAESEAIGPIAIVGHGGPIHMLLKYLSTDEKMLSHYRKQFDYDNPLPPAGVWQVKQLDDTTWQSALTFSPTPINPYSD